MSLQQIRALVLDGAPLPKALAAVADPFASYRAWSPLWDVLYDAQDTAPRGRLAEFEATHLRADVLALVDRAIARNPLTQRTVLG